MKVVLFFTAFVLTSLSCPFLAEAQSKKAKIETKQNGAFQATEAKTDLEDVIEVVLNGLKMSIDKKSGSILGLEYPGPGKILQARPEQSGLVDVAYPIPEFEPLRLASEYSKEAKIEKADNAVTISWETLAPSRSYFQPSGKVSATVWIKAMPDGRSISMKCRIENRSSRTVGQVLFPDLHGLLPLDGREGTYLRTAGFVRKPFIDVGMTRYPEFYALDDKTRPIDTRDTYVYFGGRGLHDGDEMIGRWLDYGGLDGGISMFPKLWAGDPATQVRIFRLEKDPNVRLMHVHNDTIKVGGIWESPEYILTPHQNGWAKGIETYKEFVDSKVNRLFPLPEHIRKGLGFRTVIMGTRYPDDKEMDVAFKFTDLPKIAGECKENGLDEIVVWAWRRSFQFPGQPPYANLGTSQELADAIKECNKIGVNISLFESVASLANPTAASYGYKVGKKGWTYHPEMIPRFNPDYATGMATVGAKTTDPRWQKDVVTDVKMLYNTYTHSITWDEGHSGTEDVFKQFLPLVKKADPRATFSAEITSSAESMADYLDYTWNWQLGSFFHNGMKEYRDVRAFNATFPAPRLNYNINRNAQDIKYAFMDNSFVNLMPSKPDGANATAWLSDYPELGVVLKQCAKVRNQFLQYFTDGRLIGACLLKKECPDAHVNAYVLPDRVLFIVMNTSNEQRPVNFDIDLKPWLKSNNGAYELKSYDQFGTVIGQKQMIGQKWSGITQQLRKMDFAIYEFIAK
jgi:hypothetical protein